jgi:hypothetical protein
MHNVEWYCVSEGAKKMEKFHKHVSDLVEAIQDCLAKHRILPCLTLLYSGMDVLASLEAKPGEGTEKSFVRWVDLYVLKGGKFSCTALDLYAARCGIVHAFSAESRLRQSGKARTVVYAWGDADAKKLEKSGNLLGQNCSAVQLDDLVYAFRIGIANQIEEVRKSQERQQALEKAVARWFIPLDPKSVDAFLASRPK